MLKYIEGIYFLLFNASSVGNISSVKAKILALNSNFTPRCISSIYNKNKQIKKKTTFLIYSFAAVLLQGVFS